MSAPVTNLLVRIPSRDLALMMDELPEARPDADPVRSVLVEVAEIGSVRVDFHLYKYRYRGPHYAWAPVHAEAAASLQEAPSP